MTDQDKLLEALMRAADKVASNGKLQRSYTRSNTTIYNFVMDNYSIIKAMRAKGYSWSVIIIAYIDTGAASVDIAKFSKSNVSRTYSNITKRNQITAAKKVGHVIKDAATLDVGVQVVSLETHDEINVSPVSNNAGTTQVSENISGGNAKKPNAPVRKRPDKEFIREQMNSAIYGSSYGKIRPKETQPEEPPEEHAARMRQVRWRLYDEIMYYGITVQPGNPLPNGPPDHWDGTSPVHSKGIFENELDKIAEYERKKREKESE